MEKAGHKETTTPCLTSTEAREEKLEVRLRQEAGEAPHREEAGDRVEDTLYPPSTKAAQTEEVQTFDI